MWEGAKTSNDSESHRQWQACGSGRHVAVAGYIRQRTPTAWHLKDLSLRHAVPQVRGARISASVVTWTAKVKRVNLID